MRDRDFLKFIHLYYAICVHEIFIILNNLSDKNKIKRKVIRDCSRKKKMVNINLKNWIMRGLILNHLKS